MVPRDLGQHFGRKHSSRTKTIGGSMGERLGSETREEPKLARTGFTGLFGKLSDEPINGLKLPVVVEDAVKRKAADAHLPLLEYLRELISISVMGRDEVKRRFNDRLDAIVGSVDE